MSDVRLLPCPSCARHVRASEGACPFCAAALPASFRAAPLPRATTAGRLSRAALFALGTSAAAVAACEAEPQSSPFYGGPPYDLDAGFTEDGTPPFLVDAAYGGPPRDAAFDAEDAGRDANDASDDAAKPDGGAAPAYGAPP